MRVKSRGVGVSVLFLPGAGVGGAFAVLWGKGQGCPADAGEGRVEGGRIRVWYGFGMGLVWILCGFGRSVLGVLDGSWGVGAGFIPALSHYMARNRVFVNRSGRFFDS